MMLPDLGPLWDTLAAVLFAAVLGVSGWVIRQLFALTSAVAAVTALVQSLENDHAERIEKIETHLWGGIQPPRHIPRRLER